MLRKKTYPFSQEDFAFNISTLNENFKNVCVLDSNLKDNDCKYLEVQKIIALGIQKEIKITAVEHSLDQLQSFLDENKTWRFGYLSYDLKNTIEEVDSENRDELGFYLAYFFVPTFVVQQSKKNIIIEYDDAVSSEEETNEVYRLCSTETKNKPLNHSKNTFIIQPKVSKKEYLSTVEKLKAHILKGDIYEVNYCQEFFAMNCQINSTEVYEKLNAISKAPFATYCKFGIHYLIGASPERYIQRKGKKLTSQPIKGTVRRSMNIEKDEQLKKELKSSRKECSENVMIVDLVRNDLSRIAKKGTVKVDELLEVYSFKQVHQLISTISCEIEQETSFTNILKNTFPMGSMTGAPKVSALKLIDQYEQTKRGLYSGSMGYITPDGDFDFNVVIRSILYNAEKKYLSFMVGSAITHYSEPQKEYEECLLKAKAMFNVLED